MLVNKTDYSGHIEFVSYTGRFPNLCSGVLTLKIDGEEVKFGHDYKNYDMKEYKFKDNNYDSFWYSGGGLNNNYDAYEREWVIDFSCIPEQYQKYAAEIDEVFNDNVPWGCCGGCA